MFDLKAMFGHTFAALEKTVGDFKKASLIFRIATLLLSVAYFTYSIVASVGVLWANALSLAIIVAYNVFYFVAERLNVEKTVKRIVKRIYKWIKIAVKTFTLGVMLYGIYVASTNVNGIRIILATLMIIMWVLQVLFEIVVEIAESGIEFIISEFKKDIDPFVSKINWLVDKKNAFDEKTDAISDKIEGIKEVAAPKIVEEKERIKMPFLNVADKIRHKKELKELVKEEKEQLYLVVSDVDDDLKN